MQFKLTFQLEDSLTLPISYHHIIQGFIYNILSNSPEYSEFLHNIGYQNNKYHFKMFVFSQLQGKYSIHTPYITFYDQVTLEVRSPLDEFCTILFLSLMHHDNFCINNHPIYLSSCNVSNKKITQEQLTIKMLSPLCVHSTYYDEFEHRKTRYLSPIDIDFQEYVNINLIHKLESIYQINAPIGVELIPISLKEKDKFITTFKQTTIVAWKGTYCLSGEIPILQFLYDAGIGSKNSQGFGMFELI